MRAILAAAFALAAAGAAPAFAQDVPQIIAPLRVATDRNGVNLLSGRMAIGPPSLSVPAAPNLRFDRVQNMAPYMTGTSNASDDGGVSSYSLHTGGGASESFKCTGVDCTSVTLSGSTFAAKQYRQAGSGALWHFSLKHVDQMVNATRQIQYYASRVDYPNGERIDYSYETVPWNGRTYYRPTTIASNLGYALSIAYQSGTFGTNGWSQPSVVTLYATAAPTVPLGRLTYSGDTITDLGGRVYTCTGCSNQLGLDLEVASGSLRLPGEAAPTLQVTQHPSAPVVASVVKDGVAWTYGYTNLRTGNSGFGWVWDRLTVDGPDGFHAVYDTTGSNIRNVIARSTDPIGRATDHAYDTGYRPTEIVLPELNEVAVSYDFSGNAEWKRSRAKPGSGLADVVETASYPDDTCFAAGTPVLCYRPTWSRDGLGRQTDYLWNAAGQLVEQTDPADQNGARRKTTITYETSTGLSRRSVVRVCGLGTTCGTANEIRTEYSYWGSTFLPSLERRIDAAQGVTLDTAYGYDAEGRLLWTDGPLPGSDDATYNRYDLHGRKIWEIGPRGANGVRGAKRVAYRDSDDKPVTVETGWLPDFASSLLTPADRTDTAYDTRRNAVRETVSSGGTTYSILQRSFQDSGRLDCEARRMNPATFAALPASACAPATPGEYGVDRITRNEYDAAGQLLKVQKAFGTPIQQDYAKFEYTPNGQRRAVIDANGNRAEMTYDGFDRQRRWIFPSNVPGLANPADYEEYGYDLVGNRTSLRKRDGSVLTFQYDALNRVTRKTVPARAGLTAAQTRDVFYDYDLRGLQTRARFDNLAGEGVTSVYDGFGRLTSSATTMGGTTRTLAYLYDAAGNRSRVTWPDGGYVTYAYDPAGRMTTVTGNSGTVLATFAYDAFGRRQGLATPGTLTGYGHDGLSRLTALTHGLSGPTHDQALGFTYNPASQIVTRSTTNDAYAWIPPNIVSRTYAVNGLNQYSSSTNAGQAPVTFSYDLNGNLVSDGPSTFVYDVENRLVSASGGRTAGLTYDPLGRLWQVTGTAGSTRFLYDGDELVAEYNVSGTLLRRYVHGAGADDPLIWYEGASGTDRRTLIANHQGSIVAVADAGGYATSINSYDPWGVPGASNAGRFQYTGQAWISELGMYYYKARIYWPALGRFLQTDPIGYKDQMNLYVYVGNDPANRTDPTGLAVVARRGQEEELARRVNTHTRAQYAFTGRNGALRQVTSASPRTGSRISANSYYDRRLMAAIRSEKTITMAMEETVKTDNGVVNINDPSLGGAATYPDEAGNQLVVVSRATIIGTNDKEGRPLVQTPDDRLMHELVVHAIPNVTGVDRGNGLDNENRVRRERDMPERADDPSHPKTND